jgi:hypothetical protein
MAYVYAHTSRGSRQANPILHASPNPPVPYSRTGATYRAVCGAQVRNVTRAEWDPGSVGRHCRACVGKAPR